MVTIHGFYVKTSLGANIQAQTGPWVIFNSNETMDIFEREKKFPLNNDNNVHSIDSPVYICHLT